MAFAQDVNFEAKGLLFLSDADMSAFSYVDGDLRKEPNNKDAVSTLSFPLGYDDHQPIHSDFASNSILGQSQNVVLNPQHTVAYVLETKGETLTTRERISDLGDFPNGKYVTVIDISDLAMPKSLYRFEVGHNPTSIALDAEGQYLAISTEEYNREIELYELDESGKPVALIKKPASLPPGRITNLEWHKNGEFLAYLNQDEASLGILQVVRDRPTKKIIRLENYGETIQIGGVPVTGSFTPDFNHFIVLDSRKAMDELGNNAKGELFVLKLNLDSPQNQHYLLSKVEVGENPIGFDIHPDGQHIIVTNVERSFLLPNESKQSGEWSLSIISLASNGILKEIEKTKMDGILPSKAVFDQSGNHIAYSVSQYLTIGQHFGGIEFLNFNKNNPKEIQKQKAKVYVQSGIHDLVPIISQ
ncbi:hypothetical protein LAG90_16800 [Marinilongibacter aquaticus]|uniref:YncE family protein n=1 Tax=Marinilongibacter aquaticus TaxID=2975157 RepID=UPI0021BD85BD|nr:hypothetical protein [Marinilongibacter aquaticus]UBM58464.1 hypothetical protein LAG90_16800 [Marinilongibacter aquaticus]